MSWLDGVEHFVRTDEPLADRTWLKIGGSAAYFAEPTNAEELVELVRRCRGEGVPLKILGQGSNVIISSAGYPGMVISLTAAAFGRISVEGNSVIAGGGASLSHVVSTAVGAGLAGLESLVGYPGTFGAALSGNAGSQSTQIGEFCREATLLTDQAETITRAKEEMTFGYRKSSLDELVILSATLELESEDREELARRMQKHWIVRRASQPSQVQPTCSLFKDPIGVSAGELIEQAGLKRSAVGGIALSETDANFITATPEASSDDVVELIKMIQAKVERDLGTSLEPAVQIW